MKRVRMEHILVILNILLLFFYSFIIINKMNVIVVYKLLDFQFHISYMFSLCVQSVGRLSYFELYR